MKPVTISKIPLCWDRLGDKKSVMCGCLHPHITRPHHTNHWPGDQPRYTLLARDSLLVGGGQTQYSFDFYSSGWYLNGSILLLVFYCYYLNCLYFIWSYSIVRYSNGGIQLGVIAMIGIWTFGILLVGIQMLVLNWELL